MKNLKLVLLLLCSPLSWSQTVDETKKLTEDILLITDRYNKTWETLNMDRVSMFHSENSFRYYKNMELSVGSNDEFKRVYPQYFVETKSWKIEVSNPVVQILSKDAAVIGFLGKAELITKDNKVLDIGSGAYTYVWSKVKGEWKIVHIHESAK